MQKYTYTLFAALFVIAIAALAAIFLYAHENRMSSISSFLVENGDFVVEGISLETVEVWGIPTGTGITEANYELLGRATLTKTQNSMQTWTLPIPSSPMLLTEVFAKGFDAHGKLVATSSLPFIGATDLYDALWNSQSE